ncbi:hypothetical protein ACM66B_000224 [Microbotryomycetes sp. NB124-2]
MHPSRVPALLGADLPSAHPLQTVNPVAGYLTNYEVYAELTRQYNQRQQQVRELTELKAQRRTRPEKDQIDLDIDRVQQQDLHTVSYECIKYLERKQLATCRQNEPLVMGLQAELETRGLTKAERLQIVNLAPQTLVELVVCVQNFEERYPDTETRNEILALITSHLGERPDDKVHKTGRTTLATGATAASKVANVEENADEDVEMQEQDEIEDMEGLIDSGTGEGALEDAGLELDEDAGGDDS